MNTQKTEFYNVIRGLEACSHPSLITEFVLGRPTGNFICARCKCQVTANHLQTKTINNFLAKSRHDLIF